MHQREVGVCIDEIACLNEQLSALLWLYNRAHREWVENGFHLGVRNRITVLEPKVGLFPVKKLNVRKEAWLFSCLIGYELTLLFKMMSDNLDKISPRA